MMKTEMKLDPSSAHIIQIMVTAGLTQQIQDHKNTPMEISLPISEILQTSTLPQKHPFQNMS